MEENLILPSFRKLKFADCNKPFFRKLMYKAFTRAKSLCDQWHDHEMDVAPFAPDKPIYYEFTACPAAEFANCADLDSAPPSERWQPRGRKAGAARRWRAALIYEKLCLFFKKHPPGELHNQKML